MLRFAGVFWKEASNDSRVIENVTFSVFGSYIFGTLGNKDGIIVSYYLYPRDLSTAPKILDLE